MAAWRQCFADRAIGADGATKRPYWANWQCRHHWADRRERDGPNWRRLHWANGSIWRPDRAYGPIR